MKNLKNRKVLLLLAIVAAMAVAVGGTIAYLVDQTESLVNTFTPTHVTVDIEDEVNGTKKENVVIKNTGSTDAYIRARIVGNWVSNEDNTTIVQAWDPDGDGEFNGLPGTNWEKSGDYYYYKLPVAPDQQTESPLFNYYTVTESVEDAHLVMDILVQAIQSEAGAAQDAWGVDPSNPNQQ